MKANRDNLVRLREAQGLTQEALAAKSNVAWRTVQRAEAGKPIAIETLAQIAATLGVPQEQLVAVTFSDAPETSERLVTVVLLPVKSGREVAELFRETQDASLGCLVDTSGSGKADAILYFLDAIEPHLPTLTPEIDFSNPVGPTEVDRLRDKVLLEKKLFDALERIKAAGLQLYAGFFINLIQVPRWDMEENCWSTHVNQRREPVKIAVLRISKAGEERLVVQMDRGPE